MKKTLSALLISAFFVIVLVISASAADINDGVLLIKGDLDHDGKITVTDARTCLRAAVGLEELTSEQTVLAKFENSKKIGVGDARRILRIAVGLDMPLPKDHVHSLTDGAVTKPTCTSVGYTEHRCSGCARTFYLFTPAVDHTVVDASGVCRVCGYRFYLDIMDGKKNFDLRPNETQIVRVKLPDDCEEPIEIETSTDALTTQLDECTYVNKTDGEYIFLFITVKDKDFKGGVVNVYFRNMPFVKTTIYVTYSPITLTHELTTNIGNAPDPGRLLGCSPFYVNSYTDEEEYLTGFALQYETNNLSFNEISSKLNDLLSSKGFMPEKTQQQELDGVKYTVKYYDNPRSGLKAAVYFRLNGDKLIELFYTFGSRV